MGGLVKVTLFYIKCLKKILINFSFYLLTFLSWTYYKILLITHIHFTMLFDIFKEIC